jgi:hypothetical protein
MDYMDYMIGGKSGKNNASIFVTLLPFIIALIFVIVSLATMPGTIGHKTKYVKKDDPENELTLKEITIPVAFLSSSIILLIIGIFMQSGKAQAAIRSSDSDSFSTD